MPAFRITSGSAAWRSETNHVPRNTPAEVPRAPGRAAFRALEVKRARDSVRLSHATGPAFAYGRIGAKKRGRSRALDEAVMVLDSSAPSGRFDFSGQQIPSSLQPGVVYHLRGLLGEGGMGSVYFALRTTAAGSSAAALKIVNPDVVLASGTEAILGFRKEAVALGRLNEQVPPTPYVVRLLDTGQVRTSFQQQSVELPWIALGARARRRRRHDLAGARELLPRSSRARLLARTGHERVRVYTGAGLEAVHREGVIHRDLKPGNVLCAGFGVNEVFKISDFGIARPKGLDGTFGNVLLGTPGYVAPEQSFPDHGEIGPWTDVFSFAALAFYLLTGGAISRPEPVPHTPCCWRCSPNGAA